MKGYFIKKVAVGMTAIISSGRSKRKKSTEYGVLYAHGYSRRVHRAFVLRQSCEGIYHFGI